MESVKRCAQCGRVIAYEATADFYSYIRVKYCRPCAADVHRRQIAESMRRARAKARERRELERQQQQFTAKENELLRQIVQKQQQQIKMLEDFLQKGK